MLFQVRTPPGPSSSLGDQLAGWHPEARDRLPDDARVVELNFFDVIFGVSFMQHEETLRCFVRVSLLSIYFLEISHG